MTITTFSRFGRRLSLSAFCSLFLSLSAQAQDTSDHQYTSASIQAGSRVYVQQCALCHGPQGDTIDGVNLRRGQFRTATSDEDLARIISGGAAGGRMPAFNLRPEELNGVIAYIRAGFDPEGVAIRIGDPARGKAIYDGKGECSECHRINGVGHRTAPDLSDIGLIRTPAILQASLTNPSSTLQPINRQVRLVTRTEEVVMGRRLNEDTYSVQLIDSNEQLRSLRKSDLVSYELSSVPVHQPTSLNSDEVADLVGYLLTLRGLE
ncbi:MAG: c-type cytochrome [Pseudomonadales bacterium]|nr:c-type cytochrome [Pseudomonadales bacterium]MCP5357965.1 c-type cytochrome [Pseudomonadales bacterium]